MSSPIEFDPPQPEELSEYLSGYEVLNLIAKGGMGAVYRARQTSLDRLVAIKFLPRELGDAEFKDQFQAEARAMAKLNHANLIGIYDFGEANGMPYIVMELVEGSSLYYSCYEQVIDQETACEMIIAICRGLEHAHNAGIIHQDIKPANIFLDAKAQPKIGDFGLAAQQEFESGDGVVYGTPGYAAPEILSGERPASVASDIYAVGVMLYQLLTGMMPETPPNPPSTVQDIDPRFDEVFKKATRRSPIMRYQTCADLADHLEVILKSLGEKPAAEITETRKLKLGVNAGDASLSSSSINLKPAVGGTSTLPQRPGGLGSDQKNTTGRNLLIIAALIPVIFFAYQYLKLSEKVIEQDDAKMTEKNEETLELNRQQNDDLLRPVRVRDDPRPLNLADKKRQAAAKAAADRQREADAGKTPRELLAELKFGLYNGKRDRFPAGTEDRGLSHYLVIQEPMTWTQAAYFAEQHGGFLASLPTQSDIDALARTINEDIRRVWIGGGASGRSGWAWISGDEWTHRNPDSSLGSCASMNRFGKIQARAKGEKNPFIIQWRKDGTNPGTLRAQLERLVPTLGSPSPAWPATSVTQDDRVFYLAEGDLCWAEADFLAVLAEGHLAVPSESMEQSFVNNYLKNTLRDGAATWLGGFRPGEAWTWTTSEPWKRESWRSGAPSASGEATALRYVKNASGAGWENVDPMNSETQTFLIEWSGDSQHAQRNGSVSKSGKAMPLNELRSMARSLIGKQGKKGQKELQQNQQDLLGEVSRWLSLEPRATREQYQDLVSTLSASLNPSGVLPLIPPVDTLPAKATDLYGDALRRQSTLLVRHRKQLNSLCESYRKKLGKLKSQLKAKGQASLVAKADEELKGVGEDGETFRDHVGG